MGRFISSRITFFICVVGFLFWETSGKAQCGEEGIIVNEFSNGPSGTVEYLEMVVVGCPGATVDIRGWIFDDNNGDFSGGPSSSEGIAPGHIRFKNVALWQSVAVGSIIVVYNQSDKNTSVPADDPTDSNGDLVYILPANNSNLEGCTSDPDFQNSGYNCSYGTGTWNSMSFRNGGDVAQTRQPNGAYFHGLSYGSGGDGFDGGPDGIHFPGSGSGHNYYFDNTPSDDYRNVSNYTRGNAPADETPGAPNNAADTTWINNLQNPGVATDPNLRIANSTCTEAVLTVDNFCAYNWENGAGSNQTFTVTSSGNYTVTVTDVNGCQFTDNIDVTVGGNLDVTLSLNPNTACAGETITATVNGSDVSGATFNWSLSGGARQGAATGNPKDYIFNTSGSYTISVTVDNAGCTETLSENITVNPLPTPNLGPDIDDCSNNAPFTLNPGTYASYSWSPNGETTPTIQVSSSGTYSVTVTDANGCEGTDEIDVTVNPSPNFTLTADPGNVICEGESVVLEAEDSQPIIDPYTYTWQDDASAGNPRTVSPSTTTTYTISAESSDGCTQEETITITVNPLPSPDLGPDIPVCADAVPLTLDAGAYASYQWSPNGETTQTIDVSSSGTYGVTVTDANGCEGSDAVDVTVNPNPTISITQDPNPICSGQDVSLNVSVSSGTFTWGDDNSNDNPRTIVAPNDGDTYNATVVDGNGCEGNASININVSPLPAAPADQTVSYCLNETATQLTPNGAEYNWYDAGMNPLPGAPTPNTSTVGSTTYFVSETANGCEGPTGEVTVVVNNLPTGSITQNPNPVCDGEDVQLVVSVDAGSTFIWDDNGSTNTPRTISNPSDGDTYSITITDGNGCEGTADINIQVAPNPTISITQDPNPICSGQDVSLNVSVSSGTFTWDDDNSNDSPRIIVAPNDGDTYNATVVDGNGCEGTASININVTPLPSAPADQTVSYCLNETATQLTPNDAEYNWYDGSMNPLPGAPTPNTSTVGSTTYFVSETANGCEGPTGEVTVVVNDLPTGNITQNPNPICDGEDVQLVVSVDAGSTFIWDDNGSTNTPRTISNPSDGDTYSITITDGNGCEGPADINIQVAPLPTVSIAQNPDPVCAGEDVELLVNAGGGTTFTWDDDNSTTNPRVILSPTNNENYSLTAVDGNGCQNTASINIEVTPIPSAPADQNIQYCRDDFASQLAPNGSNFQWFDASMNPLPQAPTPNTSVPGTTTYYVREIDPNGNCASDPGTVTVTVNNAQGISIAPSKEPLCLGEDVTLTVNFGSGTFTWDDDNSSTNPRTIVNPGDGETYSVTLNDANSCSNSASYSIQVNPLPPVSISAADPEICIGDNTQLTANGADNYEWEDGSTVNPRSVSPTNTMTYSVTGTDANGCENTDNITVTVNPLPTVSINADNTVICNGDNAELTASGASNYEWEDGSTVNPRSVSPTNTTTYSVTGTDANGCENTDNITITVNPLPTVSINADNTVICDGDNAELTASGATNYEWEDGSTVNPRSVSPTNTTTYIVTGIDANGCENTDNITITVNPLPPVSINATDAAICTGENTRLTANGADSYEWEDGSTVNPRTVSPTSTTTYSVTGTDANGCENTDNITITVNPLPNVSAIALPATICAGESSSLNASGASSYEWEDGSTINPRSVSPTSTTTYSVTGTDANGCENTDDVIVTVNPLPTVSINADNTVICDGDNAELTASGANSYEWEDGSTVNPRSVSPTSTTTYSVTGTDANGCENTDAITITVNPLPPVSINATDAEICTGDNTQLTANGADSYEWEDGSTVNPRSVSPISTTTYSVTGTDANGCENTDAITITVNPLPTVSINADNTVICDGANAELTASGANSYEWEDGSAVNPRTVLPTSTATYSVTGTDANGCKNTDNITITVNPLPTVSINAADAEICTGDNTQLTANGADNYEWEDGSTVNPRIVSPTNTTTYSVTGTDANGCENTGNITITVNPLPNVTVVANPSAICEGESSSLQANGANSYVWEDDNSTINPRSVTPTNTTIYTVTGEDVNGCVAQASASVNVKPVPAQPQDQSATFCQFDPIAQLAPNTSDYFWYDENVDPLPQAPDPDSSVSGTRQYYYQQEVNGCFSPLASYIVTINPKPTAFLPQSRVDCQFDTPQQLSPNSADFIWFDDNGNTLVEAPTPNTGIPGETNYTFRREANGCLSDATPFTYTVNPKPATPSDQEIDYCFDAIASQLQPQDANFRWYDSNQNLLPEAPTPETETEGTQQYFCSEVLNGCESDLASVRVNVSREIPPFQGYTTRYCQFESPQAIDPGQGSPEWFDEDGNSLGTTNPVPGTDSPGITRFYVRKVFAGCRSEETEFVVAVIARPNTPSTSTDTIFYCQEDATNPLTPRLGNYTWYDENNTDLGNSVTPDAAAVDTSTFYVSITENGCESLRDSIVVVIKEKPQDPVAANTGPYCEGDVATALVPNGTGYTWFLFDQSTNQYINQGNTTTPNTTNAGTLQYQVLETRNGCTSDVTLVSVTVNPKPLPPGVSDLSYCVGENALPLTANAANGNTVNWYDDSQQPLSNVPTPNTATPDTTVYFASQTQQGCVSDFSDPLEVIVRALPTIGATASGTCPGEPFEIDLEFTGVPNFDFDVINTSNQNRTSYTQNSNEDTLDLNVQDGTYEIHLQNDAFCNADQTAVVALDLTRFQEPEATLAVHQDPCLQETYVVANFSGTPNYSFAWDVPGGNTQTKTTNQRLDSVLVTQPGTVRLLNLSDANCAASTAPQANVAKTSYNSPSLMALDNTVCEGSTMRFTVSNLEPGMETVVRLDGEEYRLTQSDIISIPDLEPGCYDAEVFATDVNRGCSTASQTWPNLLCVQENPISDFELQREITFEEATNRVVENNSIGGEDFFWTVNGEPAGNTYDLTYDFGAFQSDSALVCLEAAIQVNAGLVCADTLCKTVSVANGAPIYISNAFTPDGNILNETWGPQSDGVFDYYELQVFDRWGQVVFEAQEVNQRWDGRLRGELVRPGIYAYILKYRYSNEIGEHRVHGDVRVLR